MKSLKALLIEDSETDEQLLLRHLAEAGYDVQSVRVQTASDLKKALAESDWDIILSDYALPGFTGLDALRVLRASGRDIPLIIVSRFIGEDVAVEAMRSGINDYLLKDNLTRLAPAIEREMENAAARRARKQAEAALRQSETSLASAQRIAHIGNWDWDIQNDQLSWSEETYRIFGLARDQFEGTYQAFIKFVHPDDRQFVQSAVDAALTRSDAYFYEHRIIRPDGEERIVCEIGEVTFDETGKPLRFNGTVQDITERKRAEEALEKAAKRERAIIENALDVICTMDAEGRFVSVSPASLKVWGYQPEELVGRFAAEFVVPEDVAKTGQEAVQIMSGSEARDFENRYRHKNGSPVDMRWTFFWSEKDRLMFCVAHDNTERKAAETEMRLMKSAIDSIVEGIIIADAEQPDNPIIYTNAAFENLTGYSFEEVSRQNCRFMQGPETSPQTIGKIREAIEKRTPFRGEILNYNKNGESFWNNLRISPVFDHSGRLTHFVGVQQDISERKRAEQMVIESEEKYRSIVETANEGIWLTDAATRTTYVNRQMAQMLGYTVEEMLGRPLFDFLFEEDLPDAQRKYERRKMGESEIGEFRMRRKDGSEIITLYNTTPRRNQAGEIVGFLSMRSDITESKKAERGIKNAEAKYRRLIESSPAVVYLAEPYPPFSPIYVSPNVEAFGYTTDEWFVRPDMWVNIIHEDDRAKVVRATEVAIAQETETDLEYRIVRQDNTIIWLHDKGRFISDEQGNKTGWQGVMVDITRTKELEEQLRQSQRLESVGRLAGGIAHDFNNMLTVINGYSELTLRLLKPDDPLRDNIEEIKKAGERSALLTQQLLAFSRQQVLKPVVLNLNEVITETLNLLQRLIGEDVELAIALNSKTGRVNADPGQLSQIIMNLAVNARDAMPHGGKLTIETANVFLEPADARRKIGILPGAYVMLAVCDTGHGMDEKIQQQIFEPFFTTKELGKGTGLGLATVYGIVKQSGGNIEFDSVAGAGTTFRVYLPRVAEQPEAVEATETSVEFLSGTETVLLVEDEEVVRNLSKKMLETGGYTVIEARDGLEALKICAGGKCEFDLLMTDIVMPQMGGWELAEKLTEKLPNIKILFTSGYNDDAMIRRSFVETNTNFIQKPFTFDILNREIRKLLDAENLKSD